MKKNILITGASGFVGSHILDDCLKNNFNVKLHKNMKKHWVVRKLKNNKKDLNPCTPADCLKNLN